MSLQDAFEATADFARARSFDAFSRHIPHDWIEAALTETGTASVRRRRLPVEQVVWLVIGMALYRDRSIEAVVDSLDLSLPAANHGRQVSKGAIPDARARLGVDAMQRLFEQSGGCWGHESADRHRVFGLALYGIDGSSLRVADTKENRAEFGEWTGQHGASSHPLVRVVVCMALRSHVLVAARFGSYRNESEHALANPLRDELPPRSLTIVDRNFLSAPFLLGIEDRANERHWMTRAKSNTTWRVLKTFADGDELVEMKVSPDARKSDPSLPTTWTMRAIRYQRPNGKPQTLLTSLLDPIEYPKAEVIALYHERWELELGYDELKTEMLEREETLRSLSPKNVRQEIWGLLLAFNLVRVEMERVAALAKVPPTRVSFIASLQLIRTEFDWLSITRSPGAIPKHLARLEDRLQRFILPPRRSERSFPREVKRPASSYKVKKRVKTPN